MRIYLKQKEMKKKRTIVALLALLPLGLMAQNHRDVLTDSATHVVERYVQMLDIDNLPKDSLLVMETAITTNLDTKDTIWMRRWYAMGERHRIEVWNGKKMEYGLVGNGKDRYRYYMTAYDSWESINAKRFEEKLQGYDFRGPLYHWEEKGARLSWNGRTELKGQPLLVVKVECPNMYNRYYMFEPESGLLTLIFETDELFDGTKEIRKGHIEWKSYHEFQPLQRGMLPSLESFMRDGVLTIMSTTYHFEAINSDIFERD